MMDLTEKPVPPSGDHRYGAGHQAAPIGDNGVEIDLGKPFERLTMAEALRKVLPESTLNTVRHP